MSDESRNSDRDREAAPSKPRSRWDRSSRDQPLVSSTRSSSDVHNDSHPSSTERSGIHRFANRSSSSPEAVGDSYRLETRRFIESEDGTGRGFQRQPYSNPAGMSAHSVSISAAESRFQDSFPYKDDGASDDNDSDDNLRDEALEHHYQEYEAVCRALANPAKPSSPDSEAPKRSYDTAFSVHDQAALNEPQLKKPGFSMTMDRGLGAASTTVEQPRSSGFGFSMAVGKAKPLVQTTPFSNLPKKPVAPIKMSLGVQKLPPSTIRKPAGIANVFNDDDDSDEEEMPPEAKMRMRNLGRETPTAAGPNSFGKGNLGFCDRHKIIQRELQKKMDEVGSQK